MLDPSVDNRPAKAVIHCPFIFSDDRKPIMLERDIDMPEGLTPAAGMGFHLEEFGIIEPASFVIYHEASRTVIAVLTGGPGYVNEPCEDWLEKFPRWRTPLLPTVAVTAIGTDRPARPRGGPA